MNRLDKIEARANAATEGPWNVFMGRIDHSGRSLVAVAYDVGCDEDADFIAHARADVPDMAAALRAVLELHAPTPSDIYPHDVCHHPHCTDPTDQMEQSPWPCPTVTAIRQHIGDDL